MIISRSKLSLKGIPAYRIEDGRHKKFIAIFKYEKIIKYKMTKSYDSQSITIKLYGNFKPYQSHIDLYHKGHRPVLWMATGPVAMIKTKSKLEYLLIKNKIKKDLKKNYEKYIKIQV